MSEVEISPNRVRSWREALSHALTVDGHANIRDLADAITGEHWRESLDALTTAARELLVAGEARLDPNAIVHGMAVLLAVDA